MSKEELFYRDSETSEEFYSLIVCSCCVRRQANFLSRLGLLFDVVNEDSSLLRGCCDG